MSEQESKQENATQGDSGKWDQEKKEYVASAALALNGVLISENPLLRMLGAPTGTAATTACVLVGAFMMGKVRAEADGSGESAVFVRDMGDWLTQEAKRIEQASYELVKYAQSEDFRESTITKHTVGAIYGVPARLLDRGASSEG